MSGSREESGATEGEMDNEVLAFLDQHCLAMQAGEKLPIPAHLLEEHPDLEEMLECMNLLESFAVAPVSHSQKPFQIASSGFSSSMMQQLPREFGSFLLEEELGRGGMGVIYKARHKTLESHFALKMIRTCEFASVTLRTSTLS